MRPSDDLPHPAPKHRPPFPWPRLALCLVLPWLAVVCCRVAAAADDPATVEQRLADAVRYLASDELRGRGVGTEGIDLAADYIARQFAQIGLKTGLFDESPMQRFSLPGSVEIGPESQLKLIGPANGHPAPGKIVELQLGKDFTPLAASGTGEFDLPLVFVGYGITAKAEGYDDYAGVDATGKAVVVLRSEPQQDDPQSVFDGTRPSAYARLNRKLSNARYHGAAAVIFCNDRVELRNGIERPRQRWQQSLDRLAAESAKLKEVDNPTLLEIETQQQRIAELLHEVETAGERLRANSDPLLPLSAAGSGRSQGGVPVLHCRRAVLDRALQAVLDTDLASLEEQIDEGPEPHSRELTGWHVAGRTELRRQQIEAKNVVAVLQGEGPLAEETVVVGAHYDHLGMGSTSSRLARIVQSVLSAEPQEPQVYNGADDNASGVAALLEIARTLANRPEKLGRRVVFIAFSAEERGLLGSRHYVTDPLVPLEQTVAMVNLDMVGRLRDNTLTIMGAETATAFGELLDRVGQHHDLKLERNRGAVGSSDHASFRAERIPAIHVFTGTHSDLHRPTDDFEKLNVPGMRQVCDLVTELIVELANAKDRPQFVAPAPRGPPGGRQPFFGVVADTDAEGAGCTLRSVLEDGPAQRAGLAEGDVIVELGGSKIATQQDIRDVLGKHKAGDRLQVVIRRQTESLTLEVTLDPPR